MKFPQSRLSPALGASDSHPHLSRQAARTSAVCLLLASITLLVVGCRKARESPKPSILLERIPPATAGGRDPLDRIAGRIVNGQPGSRVALYAHTDAWYIQPFRNQGLTDVASDGSWTNVTHLGSDYAAVLVRPGYRPRARLSALPVVNGDILAVATAKGSITRPAAAKTLRFSGYDWTVRSSLGDQGGEICDYDPSNAWVDDKGYLHLRMGPKAGKWHCAGISLNRSFGYGTYRFLVSDSAQLPPSPVLAIFTRADLEDSGNKTGLGIELSRWGTRRMANAGYIVEPYYLPGHTAHFSVPAGLVTHVLRWEPDSAEFQTFRGASTARRDVVMDHIFKAGIPIPSTETIRLDLYDFQHSHSDLQHPVEVVVRKFDYFP